MGWNIGVKTNSLEIPDELQASIIARAEDSGNYISFYKNKICFDYDAMEYMDFLWQDWVEESLDHPSVNGDVVFISASGDNCGEIWGYRFIQGKRHNITADVIYKIND